MKNSPELLERIRTGSQDYLDQITSVTLFSQPPPEQVEEFVGVWEKRCLELGLGADYNQVPSKLRKGKLETIAINDTDLGDLRSLTQKLFEVLSEAKPRDVEWRTSLYVARERLRRVL